MYEVAALHALHGCQQKAAFMRSNLLLLSALQLYWQGLFRLDQPMGLFRLEYSCPLTILAKR